jgi:conjugal transfer ATP-binding protein TraC
VNAEHGRPFNAKSKLSPDARFIVTDLRAIKDHKSIRAPVLLLILAQYKKRMFDSPRSKQKMCAIDEAWSFFSDDPIASNYVIEGFRTGRKHNASFVTLTQGVQDYYAFDAAKPAWENSSLKFVFLQDHTSLLEHQKVHNTFSSLEMSLLGNFPKAKHAGFSQVLFKTNDISSVHRLFVDPYTLVMLSSAGEDYEAVKNLVQSGMSYTDAISEVACAHYGERHA